MIELLGAEEMFVVPLRSGLCWESSWGMHCLFTAACNDFISSWKEPPCSLYTGTEHTCMLLLLLWWLEFIHWGVVVKHLHWAVESLDFCCSGLLNLVESLCRRLWALAERLPSDWARLLEENCEWVITCSFVLQMMEPHPVWSDLCKSQNVEIVLPSWKNEYSR